MTIAAAIAAAVAAWCVAERTRTYFVPPQRLIIAMGQKLNRPSFENRVTASIKNAALTSGEFGAVLGLAMGLAGGFWSRSWRSARSGAILGLFFSATAGASASALLLPIYFRQLDIAHEALSHDNVLLFLMHAGIWSAVAAGAGVAFRIGLGPKPKLRIAPFLVGGIAAGLSGALIYEIVGALLFPTGRNTEALGADWAPRLIGWLAVAIASALFFAAVATSSLETGTSRDSATLS